MFSAIVNMLNYQLFVLHNNRSLIDTINDANIENYASKICQKQMAIKLSMIC
jgi:hypothetical protein